jgi:hypothetical protein
MSVDVEHALLGRGGEPFGEFHVVEEQRPGAEIGAESVDEVRSHCSRASGLLLGRSRSSPGFHDHVVRPVKGAALKAIGERRDVAVRLLAGNARRIVLANGQSALEVARQTVGTISRLGEHRCGLAGRDIHQQRESRRISARTGGALLAVLGGLTWAQRRPQPAVVKMLWAFRDTRIIPAAWDRVERVFNEHHRLLAADLGLDVERMPRIGPRERHVVEDRVHFAIAIDDVSPCTGRALLFCSRLHGKSRSFQAASRNTSA